MSPSHFFEHGIAVFGQQTGVVAVALILLRAVDPEGKTPVPQQFSYKQLIHSLLFGGGLFTSLAVPLLAAIGVWWFSVLCSCLLGSLLALNGLYCRKKVFPELRQEAAEYAEESRDDPGEDDGDGLDSGDLGVEGLLGGAGGNSEYYEPPAQDSGM